MCVDAALLGHDLLALLSESRFARVVQLVETTSTNDVAADMACAGADGALVVVAEHQSAGRGRLDRRWEAPASSSVLFSVLMPSETGDLGEGRLHLGVAAVSLALVDATRKVAGVELGIKWPNDLVERPGPAPGPARGSAHGHGGFAERKVAGLLATVAPRPGGEPSLVVGAGVNVHWAPEGGSATCLDKLAGRTVDRACLLVEALLALDDLCGRWHAVEDRYRAECLTVGRAVRVELPGGAPPVVGLAEGVAADGALVVRCAHRGRARVLAGDVTHVRGLAGSAS